MSLEFCWTSLNIYSNYSIHIYSCSIFEKLKIYWKIYKCKSLQFTCWNIIIINNVVKVILYAIYISYFSKAGGVST